MNFSPEGTPNGVLVLDLRGFTSKLTGICCSSLCHLTRTTNAATATTPHLFRNSNVCLGINSGHGSTHRMFKRIRLLFYKTL
jgi:hypothetical protein